MTRNKYRAKKVKIDGMTFDSQKEYRRWCELKLLEKAGEIDGLQRQFRIPLYAYTSASAKRGSGQPMPVKIRSKGYPNGRHAVYVADFKYWAGNERVLEDTKGTDTPVSRLKRAIVEAMLGIEIRIT